MNSYFILWVFFIFIIATQGCDRNVIWQSDFCLGTEPLANNTILPPSQSACGFYVGDTLSFINNDADLYENVFQVNTEEEMMNCNATNAINPIPLVVRGIESLNLVSSNDFVFTVTKAVYLLSTSNGSMASAENDRTRNISCLQMAFFLATTTDKVCALPMACRDSVLNDTEIYSLGCNYNLSTATTTATTATIPTIPTTPTTQTSTMSRSTIRTGSPAQSGTTITDPPTISTSGTESTETQPTFVTTQFKLTCLTLEYNLQFDFCLDWALFPLLGLIILVCCLILIACGVVCYLKHWLCFYYCGKNSIKPSRRYEDLYVPPSTWATPDVVQLQNIENCPPKEPDIEGVTRVVPYNGIDS
ncbi:hypothetical protein LOD99_6613 [Oopsacas minuta]|uniref:Uncharacterized protein n=1 Tax=Oopsacas minuta TaxID=111878 RepID=A0AAV7JM72_9METZ|nr:hypothetical protein LOD99_6613 [Oopsacas minuta]